MRSSRWRPTGPAPRGPGVEERLQVLPVARPTGTPPTGSSARRSAPSAKTGRWKVRVVENSIVLLMDGAPEGPVRLWRGGVGELDEPLLHAGEPLNSTSAMLGCSIRYDEGFDHPTRLRGDGRAR